MELAAYVHVTDEQGGGHWFGPGGTVPAWARSRITNPAALEDRPEQKPEPTGGSDGGGQEQPAKPKRTTRKAGT